MIKYKPRLTAADMPENDNKYYIRKADGGYSPCIGGHPQHKQLTVLSNCVGWAIGRAMEILQTKTSPFPSRNAEDFYNSTTLEKGQTPKNGAIMCWLQGQLWNGGDGAGHVAVVEKVISDTEIITSESAYGGAAFYTKRRVKGDGNWGMDARFKLMGFIYLPEECVPDDDTVSSEGNSPLISYTKISPHRDSPRNHKIDTITIHCVVGQCNVEPLGELFQTKAASSNYGIGKDGRIAMYVEEKDRSYCSSSAANDNRAITIECASDTKEPFAVNDKVYAALIDLLTVICKRNGIPKLLWRADKSLIGQVDKQNMTVHRWFHSGKSCPGTYLYERMGQIADEVNKRLGVAENNKLYRVQIGAFTSKQNAENYLAKAKQAGFSGFVVLNDKVYRVQIGAFSSRTNAENYLEKARQEGFGGFVIEVDRNAEPEKPAVVVGCNVCVNEGAKDYNGRKLASFVYNRTHIVKELRGDRAVITYGGAIVAAVNVKDLTVV